MESVTVEVHLAPVDCWACGAETSIISSVTLSRGGTTVKCSISDFTAYQALIEPLEASLQGKADLAPLKMRFSKSLERSYMSNGCAHCDALFGQHFELQARYDEKPEARFVGTDGGWGTMIDELLASEDGHLFR